MRVLLHADASPKLRGRIDPEKAERLMEQVAELGEVAHDSEGPPAVRSSDPGDNYLLALGAHENVPLVSGDDHLLTLRDRAPVFSPREFLERFERGMS